MATDLKFQFTFLPSPSHCFQNTTPIFADTDTFSGNKYFCYRFRDFFPIPNFSDTAGSKTFFRYQFFPIPVLIPQTNEHSRYRGFPVPVRHTLESASYVYQQLSLFFGIFHLLIQLVVVLLNVQKAALSFLDWW